MRNHPTVATGLLLTALLAALLTGCAPQGGGSDGAILLEVPEDPTVTFKVWVKAGSANDPPGKEGLAYLTGQLISDGATEANSYEAILELLYPLASWYSIRVDREMTVLTGRTHRDNLEKFYPLFTDAYQRPAFGQEDFDRLKTDTLNYLKNTLRYAQDEELGKAAFHAFVFDGQRYAHPPQGTVSSVENLTIDDVRGFYERFYTRDNVTVALGGGFDDLLVKRFKGSVQSLPGGAPEIAEIAEIAEIPEAPGFEGRHVTLVDKEGADASISFGFPIDVTRGERDFYALWIANSWLGEHRNSSSHLFQVIRASRRRTSGVAAATSRCGSARCPTRRPTSRSAPPCARSASSSMTGCRRKTSS
jgi:zinc protease